MKKALALILALVMVLSLCACGAKEEPAAPAAPAAPAEEAAPAATEKTEAELLAEAEPITITLGQNDSGDIPPVKGAEAMIALEAKERKYDVEKHKARNCHNAHIHNEIGIFIAVHLAHLYLTVELISQLVNDGRKHLTGSAPACPKIHKNGTGPFVCNFFFKIIL